MKKIFSNLSIDDINQYLAKALRDKPVNVFKLFLIKEKGTKLSVTVAPRSEYLGRYHGLHPEFSEEALKCFLFKKQMIDSNSFWEAIFDLKRSDGSELMDLIMSKDTSDSFGDLSFLKRILLGRSILQMSLNYGFVVDVPDRATLERFENDLERICKEHGTDKNLFLNSKHEDKDKDSKIKLLGIWPDFLIRSIGEIYGLDFDGDNNCLKLVVGDEKKLLNERLFKNVLSYKQSEYHQFVGNGSYYSGVMPRVMGVNYKDRQTSNDIIRHLSFSVCLTTYATVEMMDNSRILLHPFFSCNHNKKQLLMNQFDDYEDSLQKQYLFSDEKNLSEMDKLNAYLSSSYNTHTIAVSCNLKTVDHYLVAAQRDLKSIDAGEFYCSANGQSEFVDRHVNFYKESVFEDLPSMYYDSDFRVDFNNELRREVIAELGVTALDSEWDYVGVSYLAMDRSENIKKEVREFKRRMHFNVLALNKTPLSFTDVVNNQRYATERFENSRVIGIQTVLISGIMDLLSQMLSFCYHWLNRNKSNLFVTVFFFSFLLSRLDSQDEANIALGLSHLIDMVLLVGYFIFLSISFFKDLKFKRIKIIKRIYCPFFIKNSKLNSEKLLEKISSRGLRKSLDFHGIFILMYLLTIREECISSTYFKG